MITTPARATSATMQTIEALTSFWNLVQYGDAAACLLPRPGLEALTLRELSAYHQAVATCGVPRYYTGDGMTEQVFDTVIPLLEGRKFEPGSLLAAWYETVETDTVGVDQIIFGREETSDDPGLPIEQWWHRSLGLRLIAARTTDKADAAEIMRDAMALEADLLAAATAAG